MGPSQGTKESARRRPVSSRPGWQARVPRILAWVLGLVAALCAVAAIGGVFRRGVQPVRQTIDMLFLPAPANLAYAAFLAILAAAVARRKRIAWWILTVYFGFLAVTQPLLAILLFAVPRAVYEDEAGNAIPVPWWARPVFVIGSLISIAVFTLLILARKEFTARVQRASVLKALGVLAGLLVVFIALGWGLVALFPGSVGAGHRLAYSAEYVLGGAIKLSYGRQGRAPGWVNLILGLLGAIALFAALFTLFRAQRRASHLSRDDEAKIRGLLAQYGQNDSLGYFATRRDKNVVFSPTGKAAITYRVVNGVSLASGDPLGDPEAWGPAIDAWLESARDYAWTPAVMGASEVGATAYARAGLKVLELGDEAILTVREYTVEGRDMRPVRQAVHRVERAGYTSRIRRHADVPAERMAGIVTLTDAWRDTETERGFSMALSRLADPSDGQCVLVEALGPDGEPAAILSLVPWGSTGLSLDLMRRRPDSDNGLMEFMVTALAREAPQLGVERISLNFAVFRSTFSEGARIGAGPILRLWRRLLLFFSRWWQLESLYRSNAKYQPRWEPRFICFGERRELARVGLASAIAEGFVTVPFAHRFSRTVRATDVATLAAAPAVEPIAPAELEPEAPAGARAPTQTDIRLAKIEALAAAGVEAYPVGYRRTIGCGELTARYAELPPDTRTGDEVSAAGRVVLVRNHGALCFATLRDWTGDTQVIVGPDARLAEFKSTVDIGDHVGVTGEAGTSRRGQPSLFATGWTLTAKCLHPLPDKHAGLSDLEARVRQRYLDLIVNPEARATLAARSAVIHALRTSLHDRGFIEVETPMLQPVHGGANARPFVTHINVYDMTLYLRIAPELYLKRLCVGGVEKVFEIGRTFRNEGVSFKHNPEFTMLEAYQAYGDYLSMMDVARELIQAAAKSANGSTTIVHDGAAYDIGGTWPAKTVDGAISEALGTEIGPGTPVERLRELADAAGIPYDPKWERGDLTLELYERLVEHETREPTFYKDFPTAVSPLTRAHREDPRLAERWDLVAFGTELGTAYSELIDPVEQRRRLTEQSLKAAGGDPEAMELDEDFLRALEYAMPPSGGLGMGVDRLVMFLTGQTIRETLPFPLVRPASRR